MNKMHILFTDYHKFHPKVINHFNLSANVNIDWNDFEKVLQKITDKDNSNVNIHVFDLVLIPRKIIEMLNKYNVELTLTFNDMIDDDFLLKYYMKFILIDRLSLNITITGTIIIGRLYYILHKLHSQYKMFHMHDPNVMFYYDNTINKETVDFLADNFISICDNRKNPLPLSFYEYAFNEMIVQEKYTYIPYDTFIEKDGNIIVNSNKFVIENEFSCKYEDLDNSDNQELFDKFIEILNIIYESISSMYGCDKCNGSHSCKRLATVFKNDVKNCSKNYEYMWNEFDKYVKIYREIKKLHINNFNLMKIYY